MNRVCYAKPNGLELTNLQDRETIGILHYIVLVSWYKGCELTCFMLVEFGLFVCCEVLDSSIYFGIVLEHQVISRRNVVSHTAYQIINIA